MLVVAFHDAAQESGEICGSPDFMFEQACLLGCLLQNISGGEEGMLSLPGKHTCEK